MHARLVLVLVLLAGCATPVDTPAPANATALAWGEPVLLPGDGLSFEPTIAIAPDGAAYVTAHKSSLAHEGGRLSSWLWWASSVDDEWQEIHTPTSTQSKAYGFEGDVATDAEGRMYFVDTYLDDVVFARYARSSGAPTLETTRPLAVSLGQDDRPWLAAQGDGIVYLATNKADAQGSSVPAPDNGARGNIWLHVSTDRGGSWTAGYAFEGSRWCTFAVLPDERAPLHVGCVGHDNALSAYISRDHGDSFDAIEIGALSGALGANFPASAVDGLGRAYHAYLDRGENGTRILVARIENGTSQLLDVTPWTGTFLYPAIAASRDGRVAVGFQAEAPDATGEWRVYALVGDGGAQPSTWQINQIDTVGPGPIGDMFDLAFTPEGRLVSAYPRAEASAPGSILPARTYVRVALASRE